MSVILAILVMGLIGGTFGYALAVLDKKLHVTEDPLVEEIIALLPGVNCGACGQAGCSAYARHAVKTKEIGSGCLPAGDEINAQIAAKLGVDHSGGFVSLKLIVKCSAGCNNQMRSYEYRGPASCAVCHASGGNIDCTTGCLGLGDCVKACPVGALSIVDGRVLIDNEKCITCRACVKACPRSLLELVETGQFDRFYYVVGCNNPDDAISTKKVCKTGCIGCGICVKMVNESPFYVEHKISRLNYKKAAGRTDLDKAVEKCPVKIISKFQK